MTTIPEGGRAMLIPVLLEPIEKGFRARTGEPLALSAEGATEDEAVRNLKALLAARLNGGAKVVAVDVPGAGNPWMRIAGMFKDDPLFDAFQEDIAEGRRQEDEAANQP